MGKVKKDQQTLSIEIKRNTESLERFKEHLSEANKLNENYIQVLKQSIKRKQKKLIQLDKKLAFLKKESDNILVSEKLYMLIRIAKGLKPELSKKIDKILKKEKKI